MIRGPDQDDTKGHHNDTKFHQNDTKGQQNCLKVPSVFHNSINGDV